MGETIIDFDSKCVLKYKKRRRYESDSCSRQKWGIGKNNGLLFQIAEDMRFFRQQTLGKTVVMGRKTLESFPNGKPLKNRKTSFSEIRKILRA